MLRLPVILFFSTCSLALQATGQAPSTSDLKRPTTQFDLHDRAAKIGALHETVELPEPWISYDGIKGLTTDSSVIVVGHVNSNQCELSKDARSIFTRYQVTVNELLSDDLGSNPKANGKPIDREKVSSGATIPVVLPGGKVGFTDGTTAQIDAVNSPRLLNGHDYLLYLKYSAPLRGFVILGISRGAFAIKQDGNKLQWMALKKAVQGFAVNGDTFIDTMQDARREAVKKNAMSGSNSLQ